MTADDDYAIRFQPTLPARGATLNIECEVTHWRISTHAPRTGSDERFPSIRAYPHDFNPRSPHGERRKKLLLLRYRVIFQPTLPARGATR